MSATTPASVPTTGTWHIDTVHSTVSFSLIHNKVATFRGRLHGVTGSLENGVLSGSVEVENLDIGLLGVFKEHLLGEAFFDAANHKTLSFRSQDIHAHEDGTVHLTGDLTIKGVTKPITADGTVRGPLEVSLADGSTGERLGIDITTTIDRRDFGLEVFAGAEWDVTIDVALQLSKDA